MARHFPLIVSVQTNLRVTLCFVYIYIYIRHPGSSPPHRIVNGRDVKLITHLYIIHRFRTTGTIPVQSLSSWCWQRQLNLYLHTTVEGFQVCCYYVAMHFLLLHTTLYASVHNVRIGVFILTPDTAICWVFTDRTTRRQKIPHIICHRLNTL